MTACDVMFLAYASCFYQALALNQTSSPHFSSRPMPRGPPFEDVVCHHDAVTVAHLWCLGQAEAKDSARQADQWRESQERVFPGLISFQRSLFAFRLLRFKFLNRKLVLVPESALGAVGADWEEKKLRPLESVGVGR
jgi:hypothetical protein